MLPQLNSPLVQLQILSIRSRLRYITRLSFSWLASESFGKVDLHRQQIFPLPPGFTSEVYPQGIRECQPDISPCKGPMKTGLHFCKVSTHLECQIIFGIGRNLTATSVHAISRPCWNKDCWGKHLLLTYIGLATMKCPSSNIVNLSCEVRVGTVELLWTTSKTMQTLLEIFLLGQKLYVK